jgi:hypothetical protein
MIFLGVTVYDEIWSGLCVLAEILRLVAAEVRWAESCCAQDKVLTA